MKNKRAQVSIEYLIIFITLLGFLFLIVSYLMQTIPEEIKIKQAISAVKKIAKTADTVYSMGPGARRIIYVHVPRGTKQIKLSPFIDRVGGEISLTVNHKGRPVDVLAITNANITGNIPDGKTLYKLLIQTTENRMVNITSQ